MAVQSKPAGPSARRPAIPGATRGRPRRRGVRSGPKRVEPRQLAASAPRPARRSDRSIGWNGGEFLLIVFFFATVIMVVAVVLVGAVEQWWVLVPVMVVDLTVTFVVLASIVWLLGNDGNDGTPSR